MLKCQTHFIHSQCDPSHYYIRKGKFGLEIGNKLWKYLTSLQLLQRAFLFFPFFYYHIHKIYTVNNINKFPPPDIRFDYTNKIYILQIFFILSVITVWMYFKVYSEINISFSIDFTHMKWTEISSFFFFFSRSNIKNYIRFFLLRKTRPTHNKTEFPFSPITNICFSICIALDTIINLFYDVFKHRLPQREIHKCFFLFIYSFASLIYNIFFIIFLLGDMLKELHRQVHCHHENMKRNWSLK